MFRFAFIAGFAAAVLAIGMPAESQANPSSRTPVYRIDDYPYPTAPALLQWQSVLSRDAAQEARWTGEQCADGEPRLDCAAKEAALLEDKLHELSPEDQVAAVYAYFNAVKYQEHGRNCGADCWATRLDFLAKREGDCGDHALAEYFTLKRLGFAERDLQLIIAQLPGYEDSFKGGHVVLRVRVDQDYFILDNRRKQLVGLKGLKKYKVLAGLNADSVQIYNLVTPTPPPGYVSDTTQVASLVTSPNGEIAPQITQEPEVQQVAAADVTNEAPAAESDSEPTARDAGEDCVQSARLADWNPNLPCSPRMTIVARTIIGAEPAKAAEPAVAKLIESQPAKPAIKTVTVAAAEPQAGVPDDTEAQDSGDGGCVQMAVRLNDWNPNQPCSETANPQRMTIKAKTIIK